MEHIKPLLDQVEPVLQQVEPFFKQQVHEIITSVESWKELPWEPLRSPVIVAERMPTFVFGELVFALLSLSCFIHSWKKGRTFILVWWASILAGCANDAFFMFLPGVDNFYHAQGTIMLTPRLPLYILFVYNSFIYCSVVAGFQFNLGIFGNSAIVGLIAELFYSIYDLIGVKFLWWTWHDTDVAISARIFNVPIGSSMWVITFCSTFSFLLQILLRRSPRVGKFLFVFTIFCICLLCTPIMMMQMGLFQLTGTIMGRPNEISLCLLLLVYSIIISVSMIYSGNWLRKRFRPSAMDRFLGCAIIAYFAFFSTVGFVFSPVDHHSIGIHQSVGQCGVQEFDMNGLPREKFLCSTNYDEPFVVHALNSNSISDPVRWYSISGVAIENHDLWMMLVSFISLIGITFYTYAYSAVSNNLLVRRTPSINPIKNSNTVSEIPPATAVKSNVQNRKGKGNNNKKKQ